MNPGLEGKRAAVTGGARGIGRAIAELLAAEGCAVAVCARGEAAMCATATGSPRGWMKPRRRSAASTSSSPMCRASA